MLSINKTLQMEREDLHHVPIPVSAGRTRWKGINHGVLADTIVGVAKEREMRVINELWSVNSTGDDMFGCIDFGRIGWVPEGMGLSLGVRHSNIGRYAVTFAVGGKVFICDNGMISGEFVVRRRHTTNLDLHNAVVSGFDRFISESKNIGQVVDIFKAYHLVDAEAAELVLIACQKKILPWSHAKDVWNHWLTPDFEVFQERDLWSLYNAFTQKFKDHSPARQMLSLGKLRDEFLEYARS